MKRIDEINVLTRGCNVTIARFKELIDIVAEKYDITRETAFKEMQKTRGMGIPTESANICPNCGGITVNGLDGQREYRRCDKCEKREYLDLIQ